MKARRLLVPDISVIAEDPPDGPIILAKPPFLPIGQDRRRCAGYR